MIYGNFPFCLRFFLQLFLGFSVIFPTAENTIYKHIKKIENLIP